MSAVAAIVLMTESPHLTQDGSFTFFSSEFGETYHSTQGAKTEAFNKFASVTNLEFIAHAGSAKILDICYGLGYNSAAALETIWQINSHCEIQLVGLELDPNILKRALSLQTYEDWSLPVQEALSNLATMHHFQRFNLHAEIVLGDARQSIQIIKAKGFKADAIFLDPFSPRRCPQLWTVEFLADVIACLSPNGILATYSRSASVRAALQSLGVHLGTIPLPTNLSHSSQAWSQGTVASFNPQGLISLSEMEQQHLLTRAGIPLRDPSKSESADCILDRQAEAQQISDRESTSSWRRRWKLS